MHRSFAKSAIVVVLALAAAFPLLARDTNQTLEGFVAADYRDAYRLEAGSQRVVLRPAFAHSSEAAKTAAGGAAYREAFPGVQSLRAAGGREELTISDPSALVAYDVAEMSGVLAAVHDGRGVRFVPMNVREAGLAFSEPEVVDAVGRPSFGARWVIDHASGRTQIRLQLEDAMLRYPIRVSYAQGERGRIAPAAAAKRTLIPAAHATGFVTGVITDAGNSAPLTNAVVDLYDSTGNYFNSYGTDGTGHYTAEVEAGTWYVVASSSGYGTKLYNNINCSSGCTVTNGTAVNVTATTTTANINFTLASNVATLSGNVVGPGAAPLSTIFVFIYDSAGNALAAALTDGAGNWTAQVSPGGTLYARAFNFVYQGLTDQVYNGIDCSGCNVTTGAAINAPNGTSVGNINFSLHAGATITGTVTDATSAAPVTGAFINIYNSTGATVTTLNVDSSGFYSTFVGLAAGTYYAKATASGYDGELYSNIACITTCTVTSGTGIPVTLGQTRTGVDFSLANAQARITGHVTSASTSGVLGGVLVRALNASGVPVAASLSSFGDGAYEIVLPSPGTYYVATQNSVHPGYIDQVYNGIDCTGCDVTTGTAVAVAAGVTASNIDFHLTNNGGVVSGTVIDASTNAAIPNAYVQVYGTSGAQASYGFTDGAGHYSSFSGLAAGTYYATASVYGYQTELYHGISCASGCNPTTGTAIAVTAGNTTTGIDFSLTSAFARITGKVTDASTSSALNGVDVLVYDSNGDLAASATSDASGNYTAVLAASGTYYALTSASAYPQYTNQLYDHIPCTGCDPTTGTAITATVGAITPNIDFGLAGAGCAGVSIQPATLPDGGVGLSYNQTLTLANGTGSATFSILSGSLPPNLTLSSSGVISGTTTAAGVYTFVVSATDGAPCTTTREYTIEVTSNGTTVTITASPTSGTYPATITFTATVDPSAATGIVTFDEGPNTLGSAALSGGTASITVTTLGAGDHDITATYLGDGTFLQSTSPGANVTIAKGTPAITWTPGSPIVYGTPVGAAQLNATADVPGTFVYTPASGTVLNAGTYTLSVVFTPTDAANYNNATATRQLVVLKATPVITWNPASPIVYGTPLGAAQLNATADVAGSFVYAPPSGTVLNAGPQTLSATFTPTDTANYNSVTATRTITVNKATPVFSNLSAPTIVVGTASTTLSGKLLAGTLVPPGSVTITVNSVTQTATIQADGSFSATFTTTALVVGTYTINFSYPGSANFNTASATSALKVTYATTGGPISNGNGNGTIPMRVQIFNANGQNLSRASLVVTAYGVRLTSSSTYIAPETNGNGDLQFDFQNGGGASYKFNLSAKNLANGNYMLAFTVTNDPVIHEVAFTVSK
ncbi:MAG TPA: carboxypeptidase regulatory-like domain-containing protein [Thermoanaerobaculia bacterium]|nr:carboxypeptidase regulatory-like domain-containing protein [Thermoanaerobaculia bacterium]